MTTDDLRGLVASAAAGDALGSNPTRSIAGVTDNSFDLEELVCQALETILKHAAEQEQKQHYQNEKKQHATGPGTSREQTLKNSSTASLKPLKPPRPSESAPEIAVVLMVEGNGFRSDLLDHPMQVNKINNEKNMMFLCLHRLIIIIIIIISFPPAFSKAICGYFAEV